MSENCEKKFEEGFESIDEFAKYLVDNKCLEKNEKNTLSALINNEKITFQIIRGISQWDINNKNVIFYGNFSSNKEIKYENIQFDENSFFIFINKKFDMRTNINDINSLIKGNFKGKTRFYNCDFSNDSNDDTDILRITDKEFACDSEIIFNKCNFKQRVKCNGSTFDTLVFDGCTFDEYLDLTGIYFKKKLEVEFSRVKDLFFNFINGNSEFKNFSLKGIAVEKYIFYEETEVTKAANHQTFTVLKHNAIKSNDNIRAIEFHRQEMDKHYEELKEKEEKGKKGDQIILCFEKWVSNYGTSFGRVLIAILVGNFMVTLFQNYDAIICLKLYEVIGYFANDFFESVYLFKKSNIGVIDILRFFINSILIYELQKSLRKFSRKF